MSGIGHAHQKQTCHTYHHTSIKHDCNVKHTNQLCDNYSFNIKIQSPNAAFKWNG